MFKKKNIEADVQSQETSKKSFMTEVNVKRTSYDMGVVVVCAAVGAALKALGNMKGLR